VADVLDGERVAVEGLGHPVDLAVPPRNDSAITTTYSTGRFALVGSPPAGRRLNDE
jgi:hypothetical protein